MIRSFLGASAALFLDRAVQEGRYAFAAWLVAGVALVALVELAVRLVTRKLQAPRVPPRSAA